MLQAQLERVKEKDPLAYVHLEYNRDSGEVEFIFMQTSQMRMSLLKFPEVLQMDITYRINKV